MTFNERVSEVVAGLQKAANRSVFPYRVSAEEGEKYIAILFSDDDGDANFFLVDKQTGELFNTRGYGRPDRQMKRKADIGNLWTCDPSALYAKRHGRADYPGLFIAA